MPTSTTPSTAGPVASKLARPGALIFVLALAVMILQVSLTRVFSFITYHHMTYLVIGVAMLGFGAAGTFLTLRPDPEDAGASSRLPLHAALFALSILVALFLVPKIRFYPMNMYQLGDTRNVLALLPIIVLTAAPFFFGGLGVALLINRAGAAVNRIYFSDLVGSAFGALLAIVLVNNVGAVASCVLAAALAMLVAAMASTRRRWLGLLGTVALVAFAPLSERRSVLPLYVPPGKQLYGNEYQIETVKWHVITRLDVGAPFPCNCSFGGGLSNKYDGPKADVRLVFQDGSNLTGIIHPHPTPEETPSLGFFMQGAQYKLRKKAKALVIGSGGGVDVMVALHHGASHVVAVDVNPKMMGLVKNEYADFAGNVFTRDDVETVVSEGRHFLSRDDRKFDVIQLSGVDTWAALSSGAYALTENFVYTVDAFERYLEHLEPEGIVGFSRPFGNPPFETLRLAATAVEALERSGAEVPSKHIFILEGQGQSADFPWAQTLIKRSPFTTSETTTLTLWARQMDFRVLYNPHHARKGKFDHLIRANTKRREQLLKAFPLNVSPATDDVPFFFQFHRWRDLFGAPMGIKAPLAMWILVGSFVQTLVLSAIFILLPLYRRKSKASESGRRGPIFFYFASLGMGFILVEIALLQKLTVFLGGPAYALSITLFTLLLASGIGSFLSQKRAAEPFRLMSVVMPVLVVAIGAEAFLLDPVLEKLMGLSLTGRAAAAVVLVAPLGILLGVPFPAGLRFLDQARPELKPWAWGINACATVVGTTTCMLIVTSVGFRAALATAAGVYLLGWLALQAARSAENENDPSAPESPLSQTSQS